MSQGVVRIIGGQWRGRRLAVLDQAGLRPTPDRVRETLFNWLAPVIVGARCLDAFAGSGVLGFEALSRGAAFVQMMDHSERAVGLLEKQAHALKATSIEIACVKVPEQLNVPAKPFDIVFLDPPYQDQLLLPTCHYLEAQPFLADTAYIYLESNGELQPDMLPAHWVLLKVKKAGQVVYHLARREKHHHE